MLSALTASAGRKPAVLLAEQLAHESCVQPGPLVLGSTLLKSPAPTADRDRTVSRRSKPSSRTALMGEQPNPWDRLQPQDATSRHRTFPAVSSGADYISTLLDQRARGRRVVTVIDLHVASTATVANATVVTGSLAEAIFHRWSRFRQTSHGIARPRQSRA